MGQEVVKMMIKDPVKEAVQEALAEEQLLEETSRERPQTESQSPTESQETEDEESGMLSLRRVVPILAILGIAIAVRRIGEDKLEAARPGEIMSQESQERAETGGAQSTSVPDETGTDSSTQTVGSTDDETG